MGDAIFFSSCRDSTEDDKYLTNMACDLKQNFSY